MAKYRKKPVVIDAWQWHGQPVEEWPDWLYSYRGTDHASSFVSYDAETCELDIPTLEGNMIASKDDWIIRDVKGEVYPCKLDIFAATYEPV